MGKDRDSRPLFQGLTLFGAEHYRRGNTHGKGFLIIGRRLPIDIGYYFGRTTLAKWERRLGDTSARKGRVRAGLAAWLKASTPSVHGAIALEFVAMIRRRGCLGPLLTVQGTH
jgi:hypothetical protein